MPGASREVGVCMLLEKLHESCIWQYSEFACFSVFPPVPYCKVSFLPSCG